MPQLDPENLRVYLNELSGPSASDIAESAEEERELGRLGSIDGTKLFGMDHRILTREEEVERASKMQVAKTGLIKSISFMNITAQRAADYGIDLKRPSQFRHNVRYFEDPAHTMEAMPEIAYQLYELSAANVALMSSYALDKKFPAEKAVDRNGDEISSLIVGQTPSIIFMEEGIEGGPFYPGLLAYRDKLVEWLDVMKSSGNDDAKVKQNILTLTRDIGVTPDRLLVLVDAALRDRGLFYANKDVFLECNQRANVKLAYKMSRKLFSSYLDVHDLVGAGNVGLHKAAEKYDPTRGYKFLTYAMWWMRQAMNRAIQDARSGIRLPVHIQERLGAVQKATQAILARKTAAGDLSGKPTNEEIAEELGMDVQDLRDLFRNSSAVSSLDAVFGDDSDDNFYSVTRDEKAQSPIDVANTAMARSKIDQVLTTLTEREQRILEKRFGLDGNGERTLEEIGAQYRITRERIRQIEAKALRKLRHPTRIKHLEGLLDTGDES